MTLLVLGSLMSGACIAPGVAAADRGTATAVSLDAWTPLIAEAAARFGLPAAWIRAVMAAESGGRTMQGDQPITSPAGAMGLMQVMPETYDEMRRLHQLGPDPYAPRDNILAGAAYLRAMYDRFGWPGLFAAYNAGPTRYEAHLRSGRSLPLETDIYLAALEATGQGAALSHGSADEEALAALPEPVSGRSIFVIRNGASQASAAVFATAAPNRHPLSLFVPLSHARR